jgi:hypothetical protein
VRAVKAAATALCNPAKPDAHPTAETDSYLQQAGQNTGLIAKTDDIPVLLAGADHDSIMPSDANALELSAWRENCACDVEQFIVKDTGHDFRGHTSLAEWTDRVVNWLGEKRVETTLSAGVVQRLSAQGLRPGDRRRDARCGRPAGDDDPRHDRRPAQPPRRPPEADRRAGALPRVDRTTLVVRARDARGRRLATVTTPIDLCRGLS